MATKVCPECGRTLQTKINRLGIEVWPAHKFAAVSDLSMNWAENTQRQPGRRDNEVQCYNSAQPVL